MIIGFGHKSRSGKNTAAMYLGMALKSKGYSVHETSFASKLKELSYQMFMFAGLERGSYYEQNQDLKSIKLPEINLTPVEIWVAIGNKMREVYGPIWIELCLRNTGFQDFTIVTDVRYHNEIEAIRYKHGKVIRINRSGSGIDTVTDHALDNYNAWDYDVSNNDTLDRLQQQMKGIADALANSCLQPKAQ